MVAVATALPELGMAIVSSLRNQSDILLGNIIGSNIYNLLFVVGFSTMLFPPGNLAPGIFIKLPALLIFSLFIIPFAMKENVSRKLALLFLLAYAAYIAILYLT